MTQTRPSFGARISAAARLLVVAAAMAPGRGLGAAELADVTSR